MQCVHLTSVEKVNCFYDIVDSSYDVNSSYDVVDKNNYDIDKNDNDDVVDNCYL